MLDEMCLEGLRTTSNSKDLVNGSRNCKKFYASYVFKRDFTFLLQAGGTVGRIRCHEAGDIIQPYFTWLKNSG